MVAKILTLVVIGLVLLLASLFLNQPAYSNSLSVSPLSPLSPLVSTYLPIAKTAYLTIRIVVWRDSNGDLYFNDGEELSDQLVHIRSGDAAMVQITNSEGSSMFSFESGIWQIEVCGISYQFDATRYKFVPGLILLRCAP